MQAVWGCSGDLQHFVMECPNLEEWRGGVRELQRPRLESDDEVMGRFLFGEGDEKQRRKALHQMWRQREKEMRRLQEE